MDQQSSPAGDRTPAHRTERRDQRARKTTQTTAVIPSTIRSVQTCRWLYMDADYAYALDARRGMFAALQRQKNVAEQRYG
jgi:hypothetical protein